MPPLQTTFLTATSLLLAGYANAFFSFNCAKLLESRIDPIVSPGTVSGYVQAFVGGSGIGASASYKDLSSSQCTTCAVSKDKSSYWAPQLYYQFSNGSFTMVPNNGSTVTYHGRGSLYNATVQYTAYPPGLKMLSGDPTARSYDTTTRTSARSDHADRALADRVSWTCITGSDQNETPGFPQSTNCPGGLRARVDFQTCWNGVDLYKQDNSHVAYLSQIDNGGCPNGYPNLLPHLSIDTVYTVTDPMFSSGGQLVLSTGDTTGYGYHAEFLNGWDTAVLQNAVTNCLSDLNSDGTIAECPILQANAVSNAASQCPHKDPIVNEPIYGPLKALPGCVKITSGPADASASDMICSPSVTPPTIGGATPTSTTVATVVPQTGKPFGRTNWIYVGCSVDSAATRALSSSWIYQDSKNLTIENCQTYCQTQGQKYAGVENGSQCFCSNSIAKTASYSTSNLCNVACAGDATRNCGGTSTIEIFNNTAAQAPPTPSVLAKSGTYVSKGCYVETAQVGGVRTLGDASTSTTTLTVDTCVRFCLGKNLRYAGVESGNQCYCAANMNTRAVTAPLADCNMPCVGNSNKTAQICGASSRLNVYYSKNVISISKRWLGRGWMPWITSDEAEDDHEW